MTWVAQLYRDHPLEVIGTLRETFGVSLAELGDTLPDGELVALLKLAVDDPSTRLGAKVQKWSYPATIPELMQVSSLVDKNKRDQVLPWGMWAAEEERAKHRVTAADVAAGQRRLARVSAFRNLDGFDG